MLSTLFEGTSVPVLEQVANFSQARHHLLASNLANIDTPGYRATDLSQEKFEKRLKEAIERRDRPQATSSYGRPNRAPRSDFGDVRTNLDAILRHDDAKIPVEFTVAEMAKNQTRHNTALAIMTSQFRLLQVAISERV